MLILYVQQIIYVLIVCKLVSPFLVWYVYGKNRGGVRLQDRQVRLHKPQVFSFAHAQSGLGFLAAAFGAEAVLLLV